MVRRGGQLLARYRIYVMLLLVVGILGTVAPHFLTLGNLASILKTTSLYALVATGFTLVMIAGQLDLSVGSVVTLGGLTAIGLQGSLGWPAALALAVAAGALVGAINGLLVTKVRVNAFIVTLGTLICVQGLVLRLCGGRTLSVTDFGLGLFLERPLLGIFSPRILVTLGLVAALELWLQGTVSGRGLTMVGGNRRTAWQAGLRADGLVLLAFVLSGLLSGLGGALFAISINSAPPTLGATTLMIVVAAVIIGGTSMAGGRGSVLQSLVALLVLCTLFNGLSCLGAGYEIRQLASGLVLGGVIVVEAWAEALRHRRRGLRPDLVAAFDTTLEQGSSTMSPKDRTLVTVCVIAVTGCVAITAIFAMFFLATWRLQTAAAPAPASVAAPAVVDVTTLTCTDGQPLLPPIETKVIPPRPADPAALPEDDAGHWYDLEYAGWNLDKAPQPPSPGDGPRGKRVVLLKMADHPYNTAYSFGLQRIADAHGIQVKTMVANGEVNLQAQQVDQCINERPDLVIINPVDAQACTPLIQRLHGAGIPVIASNMLASNEALRYCLAWTGPDDWGQMRALAREFARRMGGRGGYVIVQHRPGGSPFFSRTYSFITELKQIAPEMTCLAQQTTDLEAEKTLQVVSDWITRFGSRLQGIVSCDDSGAQIGINEAVRTADREDIIRVSAGNSKVGMDFIQAGTLHAVTAQSAQADGAIALQVAADWFSGKAIPDVRYLPIRIITRENVQDFLPPQW